VINAACMAILFKGDKINSALIEYGESLREHDANLSEIQASLETKANSVEVNAGFERQSSISESLEGVVKNLDQQLRDLLERAGRIEERTGRLEERDCELADLIETKANVIDVNRQGESLAACTRALAGVHDIIPKQLAHKLDVVIFDKQRMRLEALAKQVETLTGAFAQISEAVGRKAEASELQEQRDKLESAVRVAETRGQEMIVALESKAQVTQHAKLEDCLKHLRRQLADMEGDLRTDIKEVRAVLASKADDGASRSEVSRLDALLTRVADLEGQQCAEHEALTEQLVEKGNQVASIIAEQAERSQRLEDTAQKLQCLQDEVGASTAEFQKAVEQVRTQLAQKLDISEFNNSWRHTIDCDLRPEINEQRLLLEEAMHKKDQIIAMVERMQADLCCALAFKGRGPSRLGPLPGPSVTARHVPDATEKQPRPASGTPRHLSDTVQRSEKRALTHQTLDLRQLPPKSPVSSRLEKDAPRSVTATMSEGTRRPASPRSEVHSAGNRPRSRVGFGHET